MKLLVQISFFFFFFSAGEPGHSTPGTGGAQTAALPVFYNMFGKGEGRESCVTPFIKYLSSLLTGVQEQSSGTWGETSASLQHPHWNPTWSHQPGQARHTSSFPSFNSGNFGKEQQQLLRAAPSRADSSRSFALPAQPLAQAAGDSGQAQLCFINLGLSTVSSSASCQGSLLQEHFPHSL